MKNYTAIIFLMLCLMFLGGCGGAGGTPPSSIPVALEGVDGESGIAVNSSFLYTFDFEVDTSTVTASTYFIVPTIATDVNLAVEKSEYSSSVCDVSRALASTVTCDSNTECLLDPTENLNEGTSYTACLTSEILKATGEAITPVAITFVTEAGEFAIAGVLDGRGVPISTSGTTNVDFNSITIMLTEVPSGDSPGSVIVQCDEDESGEIEYDDAVSGSGIVFTILDAYQYQLMNCTLTVSSGVTNLDGEELDADSSYSFTNGCAIGDDFGVGASTQSCWDVASDGFWGSWDELLDPSGILTFVNDGMAYDSNGLTAADREGVIGKEITINADEIQIDFHVDSIAVTSPDGIDTVLLGIFSDLEAELQSGGSSGFVIGLSPQEMIDQSCMVAYISPSGELSLLTEICENIGYYFRLTISASSITPEYSTDGITYDLIDDSSSNWPPSGYSLDDMHYLALEFGTSSTTLPAPDTIYTIRSVDASGMTSTTYY
ncbi:MAG: hypothetical protein HN337_06345 [Deltaproteobacteria bacterium]|nr:hypothetical protein [Deltaproteobacteria bacterium]